MYDCFFYIPLHVVYFGSIEGSGRVQGNIIERSSGLRVETQVEWRIAWAR